ncbi:MAG: choice-of-anchor D domain-containing protein [bacterium]
MQITRFLGVLALTFAIASIGCSDNGQVSSVRSGRIQVTPDPVAFAQVPIGDSETIPVQIFNVSDDRLRIYDVRLEPRGSSGSTTGFDLIDAPTGEFDIEGNGSTGFQIRYTPRVGDPAGRAQLVFESSDDRYTRDEPLTVPVDTLANRPRVLVDPNPVRFARQAPGARETQALAIRNIGSAPLKIWKEPAYGGGEDFRLTVPPRTYPLELPVYDADLAAAEPDKYELLTSVEYAPIGNGGDSGEVVIISNDPAGEQSTGDEEFTTFVDIAANADSPCILVDGTSRNFGQVPIGSAAADIVKISNCGTQPLVISGMRINRNSADNEFELDLGGLDVNRDDELDSDLTLQPGGEQTVLLKYTPVQQGTDKGTMVIVSNDPLQSELELDLTGRGSDGICPVAAAGAFIRGVSSTPRPSITATPLQYIVLDGTASSDEDGRVVEYLWELVQMPPGVAPVLGPTQNDPGDLDKSKREFRLLTAGTYVAELKVKDNDGFVSCGEPARVTVVAVPNEKILVELTWTNPEDPNESDQTGSDVDLHFVKMGPGKWFETPYDIYFRNPNNSSDGLGIWVPESPSLDIDDRDGLGPENIQMNDPANCEWYAVGVHYYKQLFGTAYVTIRIYVNTGLVFEKINKPMVRGGQFWDVARIHWDSGRVYEVDNLLEAPPTATNPAVTTGMATSGLCTNQALYQIQ